MRHVAIYNLLCKPFVLGHTVVMNEASTTVVCRTVVMHNKAEIGSGSGVASG